VSELLAGAHVTPTIRLVRPLGAGGMGTVWVADHLTLRSQVVVKFMSDGSDKDPSQVARFSREAAAASQVRGPHVVQVFDHGFTGDGTPFIVMELLDGEDLGARLARRGRMSLVEVVEIVEQVALALARAHAAHVVHRDVKPGNIFVCDRGDGRPFYKVLDFGIAKGGAMKSLMGLSTVTGAMVGTPAYASPEQLVASKQVDHRTDLWALGAVAFKALTGELPYQGGSAGALALAIHTAPPLRATALVPELPSAIDDWLRRACAVAASDRFASAREMAIAFAAAAKGDAAPSTVANSVDPSTIAEPTETSPELRVTLPLEPTRVAPLGLPAQGRPAVATAQAAAPRAELVATQMSPRIEGEHREMPFANAGAANANDLELTRGSLSSTQVEETWRAPRPMMRVIVAAAVAVMGCGVAAAVFVTTRGTRGATPATGELTSASASAAAQVGSSAVAAGAPLVATSATQAPSAAQASSAAQAPRGHGLAPPSLSRTQPPSTAHAAAPRGAPAPRSTATPVAPPPEPSPAVPPPPAAPTNAGKLF